MSAVGFAAPHAVACSQAMIGALALGEELAGVVIGLMFTGGATLAVGSWVFMFAVFAGGYAIAYFMRKEWT